MKRKIDSILIDWKSNPNKKPLIIKGARQVGKTYSILKFGEANYPKNRFVHIDFEKMSYAKNFFTEDLSPSYIINLMQRNINFKDIDFSKDENNPILFFFDEIQTCGAALTSLKYWCEEKKYFHVIASGSLLGVMLKRMKNENTSNDYPVGYVEHLNMYPMDFKEFLWANSFNDTFINNVESSLENQERLDNDTHGKLNNLFKDYVVVGGLPEAVSNFIQFHNYEQVRKIQLDLKEGYLQDINKYIMDNTLKVNIRKCFESIPIQLKQQKKKFKYCLVEDKGRSKKFENALDWLYDAGLVIYTYNIKEMKYPLDYYKIDNNFKLFLFDTGILMSMFPSEYIYDVFSEVDNLEMGGIHENAVATIFAKKMDKNEITYYDDDVYECDFVIEESRKPNIWEVKSGDDLKSKSLNYFSKSKIANELGFNRISYKQVYTSNFNEYPFYYFAIKNS